MVQRVLCWNNAKFHAREIFFYLDLLRSWPVQDVTTATEAVAPLKIEGVTTFCLDSSNPTVSFPGLASPPFWLVKVGNEMMNYTFVLC